MLSISLSSFMGTVLKQKNKEVKRKISRLGLLYLIAALIGFSLLAYQAYNLVSGQGFKRINFDIGALWDSNESRSLSEPILLDDIVREHVDQRYIIPDDQKPLPNIDKETHKHGVHSLRPQFVQDEGSSRRIEEVLQVQQELSRIELLDIPLFQENELMLKYMKQLEKEYVFNPNVTPNKGRFFIGISFAPSLSYRTLNYRPDKIVGVAVSGNTRYTYGMTETYREGSDRPISTFFTGLDLGINLKKRISIRTGIYYSVYGESISVSRIFSEDLNRQNASYYDQTPLYHSPENEANSAALDYENRYSYFEIPLSVSIEVIQRKKSSIAIDLGAYAHRLDHVNAMIYDFETDYYYWLPKNDLEIYKSSGLGLSGGFQISQFIGSQVEFTVNPQMRFNLHSTFEDCYPVDQKQYSTGLRLGVKRHFNL